MVSDAATIRNDADAGIDVDISDVQNADVETKDEQNVDAAMDVEIVDVRLSADVVETLCIDGDGDGFGEGCAALDCDDENPLVYEMREVFVDADDDGFRAAEGVLRCTDALGEGEPSVETALDCDDDNPLVYELREVFVDDDDDGFRAEEGVLTCTDALGDGEPSVDTPIDCDDNDPIRFEATDVLFDVDGDGTFEIKSRCGNGIAPREDTLIDCDDSDPFRFPGATEICNAIDEDCDGDVDEDEACGCEALTTEEGTYLFCSTRANFDDQQQFCEQSAQGYRMVMVESEEEQEFLRAEVSARNNLSQEWYIGLNDRDNEGVYVWTDGESTEETGFEGFAQGEPNNFGPGEHCIVMRGEGWNDIRCNNFRPVICEALPQ